jgi:nucleotide-binding universal stress UspA family protein
MKTDKILIAADDGDPSARTVEYGFKLAKDLGAEVILVCVIDPALASGNPDAGIFPDDALITLKTKTNDFLTRMKNRFGEGVDTTILLPVGEVQATVIETAVSQGAGMIVTGTHNRTGLNKLFNGGIAESVIHHSSVPVFVVPPEK